MIAQLPNLNTILKRHKIHPKFWPEIRGLVEEGERPSKELLTRMNRVANYKAALERNPGRAIQGDGPQVSAGRLPDRRCRMNRCEPRTSNPEDVVLVTSAGAPSAAR